MSIFAQGMFGGLLPASQVAARPPETPIADPIPQHVVTFASVMNQFSRTYSHRYDEAIRNSTMNALAMRRDCYIRALLNERQLPTARRSWQLEVDNIRDPKQREVKDHLTKVIKAIPRFTRLRKYLMEAAWYGRYASQGLWSQMAIDGRPSWVFGRSQEGKAAHRPVNGDKLQFGFDGSLRVMVNPTASFPNGSIVYGERAPLLILDRPEWRQQFIVHTHEVDDSDYFEFEMAGAVQGVGIRSQIYWAWWLRDEMLTWAIDFMQKVGTLGLLIFWYEQGNKAAKAETERMAKEASTSSALVMPRPAGKDSIAFGVEHIPASTAGIEALRGMIADYFERHIERLVIGQTLSSGTEGSGLGGTGVADMHMDTKYQIVAFDAENIDDSLTEDLVETGKRMNFPDVDFPVRFKSVVPDPTNESKLNAITKVWAQVKFPEDEVRNLTGVRGPEEGEQSVGGMGEDGLFGGLIPPESGGRTATSDDDDVQNYDAGRWITIGSQAGKDGKRSGGSRVFVKDGKIVKGAPSLTGRKLGDMKGPADHGTHRQQLNQSKSYSKARYRKEAREMGHDPKELDARAEAIKKHHDDFIGERKRMLQETRRVSKENGFGDIRNLKNRNARGDIDSNSVWRFDELTEEIRERYPGHFETEDELYDMLTAGDPEPMDWDDAYRQAFDEMGDPADRKKKTSDDDTIPFAADVTISK
jgi:Protein of unknown function (DUF935)